MFIPQDIVLPDVMTVSLKGKSYLTRSGIILADLISNCNWERPLYVAKSMRIGEYLDLDDYLVLEGMAQRIVPFNARKFDKTVDADRCYDNIMNKYLYASASDNSVYFDETNRRMAITLQRMICDAAEWMHAAGDTVRGSALASRCLDEISNKDIVLDTYSCADRLALLSGSHDNIYNDVMSTRIDYALWYLSFQDSDFIEYSDDFLRTLYNIDFSAVNRGYGNLLQMSEERFSSLGMNDHALFVRKIKDSIMND